MDALDFPVAFVATLVALRVLTKGSRLLRLERSTGVDHSGGFVWFWIAAGAGCLALGQRYEFFGDLSATLTGALLAIGLAHYGSGIVRSLKAVWSKRHQPSQDG